MSERSIPSEDFADPLGVASVYKAYFLLHTDANVAEKCNNILHKVHGEKEVL